MAFFRGGGAMEQAGFLEGCARARASLLETAKRSEIFFSAKDQTVCSDRKTAAIG